MDVHDIRRERMRQLARTMQSDAELARRADIDPALLSRLIGRNPIKPIGYRLARKIETALSLQHGWLDQLDSPIDLSGKLSRLPAPQQTLIGKLLDRPIDQNCVAALTTLVDKL